MNLKAKVAYFYPTLSQISWFKNINDCYRDIKEIHVSNDGKHFFTCKFYVDYIAFGTIMCRKVYSVHVYDLPAKKHIEFKQGDYNNKSKESREWKDKYQECIFKEWGY